MIFSVTSAALVLLLLPHQQQAQLSIESVANQNKSKRTVALLLRNYGEHADPAGSSSTGLAEFYSPVNLNADGSKQVAAQQVLYEFQQTPTKAVSNVHVDQYYQPTPQYQNTQQRPVHEHNPAVPAYLTGSETVASPVQHSSLVRHGQNVAQVNFEPLGANTPHHVQTQQYVPGKYLYVNGKIVYQPNHNPPQPSPYRQQYHQLQQHHPHMQHQQQHLQQLQKALYPAAYPQPPPRQKLAQVPANHRQFHAPQPHQLQPITKPMPTPEPAKEANDEEAEEEEAEEHDNDEREEDGDDEEESYYTPYSFDDEDDEHQIADEHEDDSERGSSKSIPKAVHKRTHKKKGKPDKYNQNNSYKFGESYSTSSKYEKPTKKSKKPTKPPRTHYKAMKYSRRGNEKPKYEVIEGRPSKNVPVVHKQVFREKWYVTKSTDDASAP